MKALAKVAVSLALAGGVAAGVTAFAKRDGLHHFGFGDPAKRAEWVAEYIDDRLDLNIEQSAKLQALLDEFIAVRSEFKINRYQTRAEFLSLIQAPVLDQAELQAMVSEKIRVFEAQAANVIATIALFTDSLDRSQKAELLEMLERRFSRWHH